MAGRSAPRLKVAPNDRAIRRVEQHRVWLTVRTPAGRVTHIEGSVCVQASDLCSRDSIYRSEVADDHELAISLQGECFDGRIGPAARIERGIKLSVGFHPSYSHP